MGEAVWPAKRTQSRMAGPLWALAHHEGIIAYDDLARCRVPPAM